MKYKYDLFCDPKNLQAYIRYIVYSVTFVTSVFFCFSTELCLCYKRIFRLSKFYVLFFNKIERFYSPKGIPSENEPCPIG